MLKLTKRPFVQLCAAAAVPIWPGPVRFHLPNSNCLLPIVQCVRIKQRRFDSATLVVVDTQYPRGRKYITGPFQLEFDFKRLFHVKNTKVNIILNFLVF